jgi:hypothetical protein
MLAERREEIISLGGILGYGPEQINPKIAGSAS